MIESQCWSPFREFMDMSDEFMEEDATQSKIENMLDSKGFVLFFEKDKDVFGVGEEGRIAFAKFKNPDEEMPKNWEEDASFSAINVNKEMKGEPSEHVISKDDIKNIKVIDKENAVEKLKEVAKGLGDDASFNKPSITIVGLGSLAQYMMNRGDGPTQSED